MKVMILGAVHGTTDSDKLIFETYKSAITCKFENAEIVTPNTIFEHKKKFMLSNPSASENEVLADMVNFDLNEVQSADLVLADISLRSTGLGMELISIKNNNKTQKLFLFAKKDCDFSDMIKGAFAFEKIYIYENCAELAEILNELLK